jgi:uncharacterized protein YkwD
VLTVVLVGLFGAVIKEAGRQPVEPVADRQAAASASVAAADAAPSPSSSLPTASAAASASASLPPAAPPAKPSPTRAATHPPTPARTTAKPPSGNTSYEAQVVTLVNQERAKAGCGALTVDSRLTTAARGHSQDMATRNYFDHNTPDGVTPWTRINNAGYKFSQAAENIAEGQSTPASVMDAWMNSEGHRENILNCALHNIGVGLAYNGSHTPYWTQDFGTPA